MVAFKPPLDHRWGVLPSGFLFADTPVSRLWTERMNSSEAAETRGLLRPPVRAERSRDFFSPSKLSVRWIPGVASYRTPYQQTVCLRRHPKDLKTRNATPLRPGSWSHATRGNVSWASGNLLPLPDSIPFVHGRFQPFPKSRLKKRRSRTV